MKNKPLSHRRRLTDAEAAYLYRLEQARKLLASCGYVEQPNGTWCKPEELKPLENKTCS